MWCVLGFIVLHILLQNSVNTMDKPFIIFNLVRNRKIFIEALRTDSLYVPYLPIKISQLVAIVTILAGIVLLYCIPQSKNSGWMRSQAK